MRFLPKPFLNAKLVKAAKAGSAERVMAILAAGGDVGAKDATGQTALIQSAFVGSVECVNALIKAGAAVNASDDEGATALIRAAEVGCAECVKALINAGADLGARTNNAWTVVNMMKAEGTDPTLKYTADFRIPHEQRCGSTALMVAAHFCHVDCLRLLIAHEPDCNKYENFAERTALMFACLSGNSDCARTLIASGADVNKRAKDGETALMYAGMSGSSDCATALINAGADANLKDKKGKTALVYGCQSGIIDCVKILLAAGSEINAKADNGETAFTQAAQFNRAECVKLLIAVGADVDLTIYTLKPTSSGVTPARPGLDIARIEHRPCCSCGVFADCRGFDVYAKVTIDVSYTLSTGLISVSTGHEKTRYQRYIARIGIFFCDLCAQRGDQASWRDYKGGVCDEKSCYRKIVEKFVADKKDSLVAACDLRRNVLWTSHKTYDKPVIKEPTGDNVTFEIEPPPFNSPVVKGEVGIEWAFTTVDRVSAFG